MKAKATKRMTEAELKVIGNNIQKQRIAMGLDRIDFADKCGISYKHYFNIENGITQPSITVYIGICRACGFEKIPLIL